MAPSQGQKTDNSNRLDLTETGEQNHQEEAHLIASISAQKRTVSFCYCMQRAGSQDVHLISTKVRGIVNKRRLTDIPKEFFAALFLPMTELELVVDTK